MIEKLLRLLSRQKRARSWGISFQRVKTFQLPSSVQLNGQLVNLQLPIQDIGMIAEFIEIILDDCYQLESWKKDLSSDPVILDIGGNVGLFSLAARQAFPQAVIHTYEPNPALEPYLNHQAQVANFHYFMQALGSQPGKVKLKLSETGASGNTVSLIDESGDIPCLALITAVENMGGKIDLAKIDCEGAEWDLFKAATVWDKVQNIAMEYHLYRKGQTLEKLQAMIQSLGFKIITVQPTNQYYGNLIASRA
jgi:FkbM family methyltransferase